MYLTGDRSLETGVSLGEPDRFTPCDPYVGICRLHSFTNRHPHVRACDRNA
jgi:hypothetical protein